MGKGGDMGPNWEDIDAFLSVDESSQIPATGAELELALGYDGELARVGGASSSMRSRSPAGLAS